MGGEIVKKYNAVERHANVTIFRWNIDLNTRTIMSIKYNIIMTFKYKHTAVHSKFEVKMRM